MDRRIRQNGKLRLAVNAAHYRMDELMPVRIEGPTPPPGAVVTADGREVGEMRSSHDGLGLALLRIEKVREGKTLAAGYANLVPLRPSWMRLENDVSP